MIKKEEIDWETETYREREKLKQRVKKVKHISGTLYFQIFCSWGTLH